MAEYKAFTETIRKIYPEDYKACIEVGPDADGLGLVRLHVPETSEDYFGKLDLTFSLAVAEHLAQAILLFVTEQRTSKESE